MITREAILGKTQYGVSVYAFILRSYYPWEVVMRITGRDCGMCRNPFAGGAPTLHIRIIKLRPEREISQEIARHDDTSGTIPSGDCFDFASLHYGIAGQELLLRINEDMKLHLENGFIPHQSLAGLAVKPQVMFSFFQAPITNKTPLKAITIPDAYRYITGDSAKAHTETLRSITDKAARRNYKAAHFAYATFSGVFTERSSEKLVEHSGLLCIDFDHVADIDSLRAKLLEDEYFETQLLFRSPSGDGIKWIIPINTAELPHQDYFASVTNYIAHTYGIEPDKSGRDVSRACFLSFDADAYVNTKLL